MSLFDFFDFIKDLIARFGYIGIALGTFLEGVFPPIPSEVIMGFAGFLVSEGRFNPILVIVSAVIGNFISVSLIWYIGRHYGRSFILRYGWWVGVEEKEIERGEQLFRKYGYPIVFACQMVPLARTLIAVPGGILKTKYYLFMLANTTGAAIWLTVLMYLGVKFGENWDIITDFIKPFERVLTVVVALVLGYFVVKGMWNLYHKLREKGIIGSSE